MSVANDDDVEAAISEHARRVISGDARMHEDLGPDAELTPPDLLERLLAGRFEGVELVAHARIGSHHILKLRYHGPTTAVVQARWARDGTGRWRMMDAEMISCRAVQEHAPATGEDARTVRGEQPPPSGRSAPSAGSRPDAGRGGGFES